MRAGFLMLALGFPIYLLWKGELTQYLALMSRGNPAPNTNVPASTPGSAIPGPNMPAMPNIPGLPLGAPFP